MNAPLKLNAQLNAQIIDRTRLHPSPTNPRKRRGLDEVSLNELANSIKSVGIAQPILVRVSLQKDGAGAVENRGNYEIIAGERRWRAAGIAGLDQVPCILLNIDDLEVLKIQLVENKQRSDLDELEEAEGYEKLLQQKDSNGNAYTVEAIAKSMGVSKGTIYARMKLLDLCQEGRDAFYNGKLDASRALLISRIPVEKLQLQVLKEALVSTHRDEPYLSYRGLRDLIQDKYMLDLSDAPFDIKDAELVPKSGSCTDCRQRTGNQPELFDDVEDKDICTNPVCHAMKKTAHVLALQKRYEESGAKLIVGKEAKKIIPSNYMKSTDDCLKDHGLVKLEAKVPGDDQNRTWQQLLKEKKILDNKNADKPSVAKTVIENPRNTGELIETVSIEEAVKKLREIAGYEVTVKPAANQKDAADQQAKQREKQQQELAIENAFRSRLFDTLHTRIEADMLDPSSNTFPMLYRMLAIQMWDDFDYYDAEDISALMRKFTAPREDGEEIDLEARIERFRSDLPNLTPAQHLMLIIELPLITAEITASHHTGEARTMLELAKELDIDADGMRKEVAAELKATAAATKKAEKTKPKQKIKQEPTSPTKPVRPAAEWPFPTPL
jgi:ParB/RepB/Spo0J family partition protein